MRCEHDPHPKGISDKWICFTPHFLSMYNGCYNISNYTKIFVLCNDLVLHGCSTETCRLCSDEARFIFQPLHSATSAPRTEIFTQMNYDLHCESAAAVQMCFPIKSSLQRLFFLQCSEAKLFNHGTNSMPHKLAVIFHQRAQEAKQSDGVIDLRGESGQRKTSNLFFIGTGQVSFCWLLQALSCLLAAYLSQYDTTDKQKLFFTVLRKNKNVPTKHQNFCSFSFLKWP